MKIELKQWLAAVGCLALLSGAVRPAAAQDAFTQGGVITVDGKTLEHHFIRRGDSGMLFPVADLAHALGKRADLDGENVAWDGKPAVHATMYQGLAYVSYRTIADWMPGLQFGATATRAVFSSHVGTAVSTHPGGTAPAGGSPIQVVGVDLRPDHQSADRLVAEATFINSSGAPLTGVVAMFNITDPQGVTGTPGEAKGYASYEEKLGTLGVGEARKVSFHTTIVNPQLIDTSTSSFSVEVNGLEMVPTTVSLKYEFTARQEK